ncbi:hypothetical protein APHAL10511_005753 [Amanita phalloides]|nr:hypothetical protein APHAL10511_005753 [Amanita phalloides]
MVFPFTFKLPVPDIVSPSRRNKSISPPVIISKKRRWVHDDSDPEDVEQPTKRRRSLTDSIVSTALSAALIGTAVGLTVYRLWRDRGKITSNPQHPAIEPPPPYQETERTSTPSSPTPTPKSPRKNRSGAAHSKRHHIRPRLSRARVHVPPFASGSNFPPTSPVLDPEPSTSTDIPAPEDEMDWIGDQLSVLIAEGKRALGCEIVVMSDSKEDEVDDGSGAWEDSSPTSDSEDYTSHASSARRRRAHTTASAPVSSLRGPYSPQHSDVMPPALAPTRQSYSASTTCLLAPPSTPRRTHTYGRSLDSSPGSQTFWKSSEDINSFDSPELRETMERARQRVMMMRSSGSGGGGAPSTHEAW